ncbi:hypothetical protein V8G54_034525 [Vigna mungo]|uniref:C2H2-type domain-containing protein n=1 Tax=Vigna mungo TaxID=3915 RepID=A0AAQ3MQN0_VIGMU
MAMNSGKSNNFSTILFPLSASNAVQKSEALTVKGMSQLGLSQRVKSLRKISLATKRRAVMFDGTEKGKGKEVLRAQFSDLSPTSVGVDGGDTESILRASQIVREKLENAVCNTRTNKKAKEMLQAKLLLAFASESDAAVGETSSTPQRGSFLNHFAYPFPNRFSQADTEVDKSITLCATPLRVCFPDESVYGGQKTRNSGVCGSRDNESEYDGRMHSNPYKKNGPYTCPKCGFVFETSQRFAAHVSSMHYRYETKSERKKRMMAKIRRRSLRLEWENGDDGRRRNSSVFAPSEVKIETESVVRLQLGPPPGWPKRAEAAGAVRIKLEPLDN